MDTNAVRPVRRALLSVSDKTGLVDLARALTSQQCRLISTGGTAAALRDAGLEVEDVAEVTGHPEILDGRVKTLHPRIHGGLLGRSDRDDHRAAMAEHGIEGIDLLVCTLYPFEETVRAGAEPDAIIEKIDIGGPAMIRSGAKNHADVAVLTDPADYPSVLDEIAANGGLSLETRRRLAAKAFARIAAYDVAIAQWFARIEDDPLPEMIAFAGTRRQALRYGENPHQAAALYASDDGAPSIATARQVQGKELSYNNLADAEAAFDLVCEFDPEGGPAVAIIKHANPCGVARGASAEEAYKNALRCDPVSAFGGIVAVNMALDEAFAQTLTGIFTEVVIAPDADPAALEVLAKKSNLRVLLTGALADPERGGLTVKSIGGGLLVQDRDAGRVRPDSWKTVTKRAPTPEETRDLLFAFTVAKHVKSNAIVYARDLASVGIGAGQMSRLDSARIAAIKAEEAAQAAGMTQTLTKGSVAASDAFFPFPDGLLATLKAGATAVIQPGGSVRDDDVIQAADEAGAAMIFTGMRHFRH